MLVWTSRRSGAQRHPAWCRRDANMNGIAWGSSSPSSGACRRMSRVVRTQRDGPRPVRLPYSRRPCLPRQDPSTNHVAGLIRLVDT